MFSRILLRNVQAEIDHCRSYALRFSLLDTRADSRNLCLRFFSRRRDGDSRGGPLRPPVTDDQKPGEEEDEDEDIHKDFPFMVGAWGERWHKYH